MQIITRRTANSSKSCPASQNPYINPCIPARNLTDSKSGWQTQAADKPFLLLPTNAGISGRRKGYCQAIEIGSALGLNVAPGPSARHPASDFRFVIPNPAAFLADGGEGPAFSFSVSSVEGPALFTFNVAQVFRPEAFAVGRTTILICHPEPGRAVCGRR
jgi:hypothetical protein